MGIESNHEGGRLRGGRGKHGSTIASADIDRHPLVTGNDVSDLADVHLDQVPSHDCLDHAAHDSA
jgi:hypothetical protein